jgi:uncharacterized membrane protein
LSSDLRAIDSSSSSTCTNSHSVSGGDIGVIVVGSILAVILIIVLLLWIYKIRPFLKQTRASTSNETPSIADGPLIIANLKEDVKDLRGRIEELERNRVRVLELATSHDTGPSGQRGSVASVELPSPTTGHPSLPTIPADMEPRGP